MIAVRGMQRDARSRPILVALALAASFALVPGSTASATTPGTQLWARHDDDPAGGVDVAYAVAASPDGSKVFVTGDSADDYATVAYRTSDGARLWASRYDGPVNGSDVANDIVVSPDGSSVFVTGSSDARRGTGWATIAYDTSTGSALWTRRHFGAAQAVAVSPDGSRVFVGGGVPTTIGDTDYATLAYDARTGATKWARRYDGPAHLFDAISGVVATDDRVFVTGTSYVSNIRFDDFTTIAYDASTGAKMWRRRYDGPASGYDVASGIAASADGSTVFVTGSSATGAYPFDLATVAYAGSSGKRLWARRYDAGDDDEAVAVAATADGSEVFVTGLSYRWPASGGDFATVAYRGGSGTREWIARYTSANANIDTPESIAASPDGTAAYVTGYSYRGPATGGDFTTLAYDAASGAVRWSRSFDGGHGENDVAWSVAADPDGSKVFVCGRIGETQPDYGTVAYAA